MLVKIFISEIRFGEYTKELGYYDSKTKKNTLPRKISARIKRYQKDGAPYISGGSDGPVNFTTLQNIKSDEDPEKFIVAVLEQLRAELEEPIGVSRVENA